MQGWVQGTGVSGDSHVRFGFKAWAFVGTVMSDLGSRHGHLWGQSCQIWLTNPKGYKSQKGTMSAAGSGRPGALRPAACPSRDTFLCVR